jgi:heme-degrading monooxygenase HmoA
VPADGPAEPVPWRWLEGAGAARGWQTHCFFPREIVLILELADIRIHPGQQAAFDEAIQRGLATVASKAQGFRGAKVNRGIENPERYILQIFWATLEDHTVHFRGGPLFAEWRAIVGPFFAAPPVVEHFDLVTKS